MGIQVEFNPDLALREHGTEGRYDNECLPAKLVPGRKHPFYKEGQRLYWLLGEIPLLETKGNQQSSKPLASIVIDSVTHFVGIGKRVCTLGTYTIIAVFDNDLVHFNGYQRINPEKEA
jgi:hypothetical protein